MDSTLLNTFFCDNAPLTPEGRGIIDMNLTFSEIVEGNYHHLPFHQKYFAGLLFAALNPRRTEAISDHLIVFLLEICNPDTIIFSEPRVKQFKTKVGEFEFVSIPDAVVQTRLPSVPFYGPSLVVVEDKRNTVDQLDPDGNAVKTPIKRPTIEHAEFQLPGEMLAAAIRNYMEGQFPQTIFALRVIGTQITFYRADFLVHYLESIQHGSPAADITIFRFGGEYSTLNLGLMVESKDRNTVIQWICNFMAVCTQIAVSLRERKISSITSERLTLLYPGTQ